MSHGSSSGSGSPLGTAGNGTGSAGGLNNFGGADVNASQTTTTTTSSSSSSSSSLVFFGFREFPGTTCHAMPGTGRGPKTGAARLDAFKAKLSDDEAALASNHIALATRNNPAILEQIGLAQGLRKYLPGAASGEKRELVRDILIIEASFFGRPSTDKRKKDLLGDSKDHLEAARTALLKEIEVGPRFVREGEEGERFSRVPTWMTAIGQGKMHFACDTQTGSIGFWTHTELEQFKPSYLMKTASDHCKMAWMLARHFGIHGISDQDFCLGSDSENPRLGRFVAGMILATTAPSFYDESGHFRMNYTKTPDGGSKNEARFLEVLHQVDPTAKLFHYQVCSAGHEPCPGHSLSENRL